MKKIVLQYGLISGLFIGTFVICSMAYCHMKNNYAGNMLVGYTGMLLAFSFVFVGVKNYRDTEHDGFISFGKALQVGLLIALVSSLIYVIAWAIDYHFFIPDYMDKFADTMIRNARNSGLSQQEISQKIAQAASMKELYKSPLMFVLFTFIEPFPVGVIVSIITAIILKKKAGVGEIALAQS